jgi:16S rRNA (adenine1518-N6/adenine1519-N6)-dimethyltransferase
MKSKIKKKYAKKSLGQNFLTDRNYIKKIISSLNPQKNELIIEIGAGRGALTESLIEKSGKVLAIEVDRDLNPLLNEKFGYAENFFLIENDALEINFRDLISLQNDFSKTKLATSDPIPTFFFGNGSNVAKGSG